MKAETIAALSLFSGPVNAVPVAEQGFINSTWLVEDARGRCILRCHQGDGREYLKEAWCMANARANGVPVAKTIGLGQSGDWHYMVQSFKGATNGARHPDQLAIWRFLGEAAAKVHTIEVEGAGNVIDAEGRFTGVNRDNVAEGFADRLNRADHPLRAAGLIDDTSAETLSGKFNAFAAGRLRWGLCHGDLKPPNMVINDREEKFLIDWGNAHGHIVPHLDFVEVMRQHDLDSPQFAAFRDGYGLSLAAMEELRGGIQTFAMARLADLAIWAGRHRRDFLPGYVSAFQHIAQQAL